MVVSMSYEQYLQSWAWQQKVRSKLLLDGGVNELELIIWNATGRLPLAVRCERCRIRYHRKRINIHHLHYRNIFHEKREDLAVLCEGCHAVEHKKEPPLWWLLVQGGKLDAGRLAECDASGVTPASVAASDAIAKLGLSSTEVYELTGPDRRMKG